MVAVPILNSAIVSGRVCSTERNGARCWKGLQPWVQDDSAFDRKGKILFRGLRGENRELDVP